MNKPRKSPASATPQVANPGQQAQAHRRKTAATATVNPATRTPEATGRTLHALSAPLIKLEKQNEELRRSLEDLAASHTHYFNLYDLAPVGYVTANEAGLILQANLTVCTLLRVARGKLLKKPLSRFILKADQDIYARHRDQLFATGEPQSCELRMIKTDGSHFWALLEATAVHDPHGAPVCHIILSNITQRKQTEEALLASEHEYRTLFDNAGDAILIVDPELRILAANPLACERLGYTHEELMSLTVNQLDSTAEVPQIKKRKTQLMKQGHLTFDTTHRRKDGALIPTEVNARLITWRARPAIMSICRDITGRKRTEQILRDWQHVLEHRVAERTLALRQSETRFRQLAEVTFEGIAISEGGFLLDGNPQLAELFGYELAEMIGRPLRVFLTRESRRLAALRNRDRNGNPHEFVGLRKDGSTFPVEAHIRIKTMQGRKMRVAALRDLSAVKQAAAQIRAQQAKLEQAHRLALVSEVSTGIIHQLGQPLCVMGASLAVALSRMKACKQQPCGSLGILKDIEASVAEMRDTMLHLRALAHPERPNRTCLDFNDLVQKCLPLLRQETENRRILLTVRCGRDLPLVEADGVQLGQVILNLARNAFDACAGCPPERRTVEIMTREIPGEGVALSVCDAGTGIPPDALPSLFAPFFTTKPEGLGIGLRLCRTIVEAHGGTIEGHNNADGTGATFRVVLPAIPAPS